MARRSLPPGFRFHPTDVELVMYYLKRKVMGKKLHAEAISEVNIYKFSPWDLPDMSCLKSKDQEWFFFCPTERKYASGARVKRATEKGYWKTTGKERFVYYDDKTAGTVKTLVFHLGRASKGERTDWVIHEYKILDDQLAAAGIQDTYVLCKVFKKNGPGPKVGACYGAPFTEEDLSDDDMDVAENHVTSSTLDVPSSSAMLPQKQCCVTGLLDPGSASVPELIEEGSNEMQTSVPELIEEGSNEMQTSFVTGLFHFGSTSGLSLVEGRATSVGITSELLEQEFDDDIIRLMASFTDDISLLINENGDHKDDGLNGKTENKSECRDGCDDIYSGLQDLNYSVQMSEERLDLAGMQNDDYLLHNMLLQDNSNYIELNDLQSPLNCSTVVTVNDDQVYDIFESYSHGNVPQFCFTGMDHSASCIDQLPVLADQPDGEDNHFDGLHRVANQFYMESNVV